MTADYVLQAGFLILQIQSWQSFTSLTDGDGRSEHLLPVCEDTTCQKSAIYLTKLGLDQVLWVWNCKDKGKYCALWNNMK